MRQSNWGRWGKDDERGLANLLQGENVVDACHKVKNGKIYNLGISVRQGAPVAGHRMSPMHFMSIDGGDFAALCAVDFTGLSLTIVSADIPTPLAQRASPSANFAGSQSSQCVAK